jgi:hypothetical protein
LSLVQRVEAKTIRTSSLWSHGRKGDWRGNSPNSSPKKSERVIFSPTGLSETGNRYKEILGLGFSDQDETGSFLIRPTRGKADGATEGYPDRALSGCKHLERVRTITHYVGTGSVTFPPRLERHISRAPAPPKISSKPSSRHYRVVRGGLCKGFGAASETATSWRCLGLRAADR